MKTTKEEQIQEKSESDKEQIQEQTESNDEK